MPNAAAGLRASGFRLLSSPAIDRNGSGRWNDDLPLDSPADDPDLTRTVGVYRLLERIGSGGMGNVYRAQRQGEEFQQTVAVNSFAAAGPPPGRSTTTSFTASASSGRMLDRRGEAHEGARLIRSALANVYEAWGREENAARWRPQ